MSATDPNQCPTDAEAEAVLLDRPNTQRVIREQITRALRCLDHGDARQAHAALEHACAYTRTLFPPRNTARKGS